MDPTAKTCCEISWEVCNKVGGIYTVVSSKAQRMVEHYGEGYYAIGPYFQDKTFGSFEEKVVPDNLKSIFEQLKTEGIDCHYGTWLVKGDPNAILIDFTNFTQHKDGILKFMYDTWQIDTLGADWFDVDQTVIWSWAAGKLVEKLAQVSEGKTVAQFHEWLSGAGLLYLRSQNAPVGTVFTTHATILGRTLATEGGLYEIIDSVQPDEAVNMRGQGLKAKFHIERASAQNAHTFTTVSEITGIEAEKLLGRKPDVLLPNGLDMSKFPTFEETSIAHKKMKGKIFDFLMGHFFPYYSFDLKNTLVYFLAGRHEFHDKGIDIFLEALSRLNNQLKESNSEKTVVAFLWVPGGVRAIKPGLLENKTHYNDLKDSVEDNIDDIEHNLIHSLVSSKPVSEETLLDSDLRAEIKRKALRLKKQGTPPLVTHDLHNESEDQIIQSLIASGLDNQEDDRVKVVYYPIYLTGADGLLDLSYYESMQGAHLGVFPSYYEPWGYTPLECGALGVPSVTTDLAGFGRFICNECKLPQNPGIWVLKRLGLDDENVTQQLTEQLHYYTLLSKQERIDNKLAARSIANKADWKDFIERYIEAHNNSLEKLG
jgi:glycogen(starch) synthase